MRIVVCDYSGHPFQVRLSRALAERGHDVLHLYSQGFQTPKGRLARGPGDPPSLETFGVVGRRPFAKSSLFRRRGQEIEAGRLIGDRILAFRPDVVLSGNAPVDAQRPIQRATRAAGARFIFWIQDLYGQAMLAILPRRLGPVGTLVGHLYRRAEARLLRRSDHIVAVSEELAAAAREMVAGAVPICVIENWAPLDELPQAPRDNDWAAGRLPKARFRAVYAGTLGHKHDHALLLALAQSIEGHLIVFSEGPGADALKRESDRAGLGNITVHGWLPFEELPFALAGADLLVAILEPEASRFSVPSKVATYLCAGRPILAAMPQQNAASRLIHAAKAGIVVEPRDVAGIVGAARMLAANPALREEMGRAGRAYAESAFDIAAIAESFERVFESAAA